MTHTNSKLDLSNEIVEEVRHTKQKLSASYGGDFQRMCEDIRKREALSNRTFVDRSTRRFISPDPVLTAS